MPFAVSQRSKPSTLTTMDSTTITARLVAINSRTRFMVFGSPLPRSLGGRLYGFQDGARAFLGNDIGGGIGIAGGDARKDRRINDSQAIDAVHAQLIVDHGHRVVAHLARAYRVKDGGAQFTCGSRERFVCLDRAARTVF